MPPRTRTPLPEAAAAASDEATGSTDPIITVEFRGQTFTIPRTVTSDARFVFYAGTGQTPGLIYEALGPQQAAVFIALVQHGEEWPAVATEFMQAMNTAAGWGNSTTSRSS